MNPSIDESIIGEALAEDESAARAEYFAEFRRDIETLVSREAVEAVVVRGRLELPPVDDVSYTAFVDPSGGSSDSMTLAIAHMDRSSKRTVLDLVRETKPPFSPEAVVAEFCVAIKRYRIREVRGDRYAGEWPREQFQKHQVSYKAADKTKSEIYIDALPMLNSATVELLDHPRLIAQLLGLERRTSRAGRDSIDHAPGSHDDLINAAAGALVWASSGELCLGVIEYMKQQSAMLGGGPPESRYNLRKIDRYWRT